MTSQKCGPTINIPQYYNIVIFFILYCAYYTKCFIDFIWVYSKRFELAFNFLKYLLKYVSDILIRHQKHNQNGFKVKITLDEIPFDCTIIIALLRQHSVIL